MLLTKSLLLAEPYILSVLIIVAFLIPTTTTAQEKSISYVLKFPEGKRIQFKKGAPTAIINPDSLKNSKFIITFNEGNSSAEVKGVGAGGNENYKAPLIKVGKDANILTFLEVYDTASMMWTIWLSNSVSDKDSQVKRAAFTAHKSSLVLGERVQTFWGTAVNLDDALNTK